MDLGGGEALDYASEEENYFGSMSVSLSVRF